MAKRKRKKPEPAAEVLRRHILEHGNNYTLSKATGVPSQTIGRFVNGKRRLTIGEGESGPLGTAEKLMEFFGLELRERKP